MPPADAQTPPAESSPGKGKASILFAAALVLGLAVGGASGMFVVGPAMAKGIAPQPPHARTRAADSTADDAGDEGDGSSAKADAKSGEGADSKTSQVYTLDNLVLNPAESGGTRFLLLSITFETPNAALLEEMKARDAELRDQVLVTLGAKTVDQLADMSARETLKSELIAATRKLFKKKNANVHIYFPQFVIQ